MKNLKRILGSFGVGLLIFLFFSCKKETVLSPTHLPATIDNYISTHFSGNKVVSAKKDKEGLKVTYEIRLSDGISLEFNSKMEIIDIDSRSKLPDSVIPEKIRQYVSLNYPDHVITGWELEGKNQQVELDNGLDLEFTIDGEFIRIDR